MIEETREYCLIYSRISTDDQNPQSCEDQENVSKRHALSIAKRVAPNGIYRDEGFSGSNIDRPALQDLLIRCEEDKSIYAVIVTESDRAARGNFAYITLREALKKFGVKVVAVTQPMIDDSEEGELIGEVFGAINGFFSKITRRKSMRALDEKANRGIWPGKAPLGYRNINIGTEEKPERIVDIDEDKAPYVRQMPKLYNQGLSYQEISDRLHDEGLIGKSDGKVSPEEIRKIIFSDFYLGAFWWRGKKYDGKHSPIFGYLEVQKARSRSQEKGHTHSGLDLKDKFVFKRLPFYCGECQTLRITAESKIKHYRKRDAEYILYHCTKSHGGWKQCTQPSINREDLIMEFAEKAVKRIDLGEDLAEFIFEEMNKDFLQKKEQKQSLLESMNRRLGQIDTELKNLFELRIAGKILPMDSKSAEEVYENYQLKKEVERKNILKAKKQLEENSLEWRKKASNFFLDCTDATNKFLKAKEEKQCNFLRAITSNLFLKDKQLIVTHKTPFSYLLNLNTHPTLLRD